jgi:Arc/MetJ-type ribon-helix-helix transcriptional regulator
MAETCGAMKKTTLYIPDELKAQVESLARSERRSEADVIRDAISTAVASRQPPEPRVPLPGVRLRDASVAERANKLLDSFGE